MRTTHCIQSAGEHNIKSNCESTAAEDRHATDRNDQFWERWSRVVDGKNPIVLPRIGGESLCRGDNACSQQIPGGRSVCSQITLQWGSHQLRSSAAKGGPAPVQRESK